jgi:predicted DNA-binding antitoxin AbrB/MazE fold protein
MECGQVIFENGVLEVEIEKRLLEVIFENGVLG